jgi:photosystem II stability/assembly factor-like uncharacterized protein/pimeloyl-ACP methyl ester carboxylesterase
MAAMRRLPILACLPMLAVWVAAGGQPWRDPSPHALGFATVDSSVKLEVLDWGGRGMPVVLLGCYLSVHMYDDFAPKLTDRFRVYGITRRGIGASDKPASGYSVQRSVHDVLEVLNYLKVQKTLLVGHSCAGQILTMFAAQHAERLYGLVYLDGASDPTTRPEDVGASLPDRARLPRPIKPRVPPDYTSFAALGASQRRERGWAFPEAELRQQFAANPDGSVGRSTLSPEIRRAITFDARVKPDYSGIRVPVLALYQRELPFEAMAAQFLIETEEQRAALRQEHAATRAMYLRWQQDLLAAVPTARIVELTGSNLYMFLSNEADVLREVRAFVSSAVLAPAWIDQPSGVTARLRGISAVSDRVAWASGSGGTVLRTSDGGTTWLRLTVPDAAKLDFRDVDAVSEDVAYVLSIGSGEASRIYKTTDAGTTWTRQFTNTDPQAFFDAMAFWDADRGIAFSDSVDGQLVILRTDTGGKAWTRVPNAGLPPALDNEGAYAASGTNVAVFGRDHVWIGTSRSRVLRSSDGGRTWAAAATPIPTSASAGIFSIAFRDAQHGIVVGGDYRQEAEAVDNAAITSDGGRTWTLVKGVSGFRSVVAYVPGTASAAIAVGPQGADHSTDDGRTWRPLEGSSGLHTFAFARGRSIGWGAGEQGRILRLTY